MLIARFRDARGGVRIGHVRDETVFPFAGADGADGETGVAALLARPPAPNAEGGVPLEEVQLLAPVPHPGKIVCVGVNYAAHAAESGHEPPAHPEIFAKFANAIAGPGDPIVVSPIDTAVDYEGELTAVIGRRVSGQVSEAEALAAVGGYTVANDVSARTLQLRVSQWTVGKSPDGYGPTGPWVATAETVPDPQALALRTRVNGEVLQDDHTSNMLFGVAEVVRYLAAAITLEPGDLILTGTPEGVGVARDPQRFLVPGDVVEVEIESIGTLANPVVAAPGGAAGS